MEYRKWEDVSKARSGCRECWNICKGKIKRARTEKEKNSVLVLFLQIFYSDKRMFTGSAPDSDAYAPARSAFQEPTLFCPPPGCHVGTALGRLYELLVHRFYGRQVLRYNAVQGTACALLHRAGSGGESRTSASVSTKTLMSIRSQRSFSTKRRMPSSTITGADGPESFYPSGYAWHNRKPASRWIFRLSARECAG